MALVRLRSLALAVALALPCPALAGALDLALGAGIANPAGSRVQLGPSLGLSATWRRNPWGIGLAFDQSLHALTSDPDKRVSATTGMLGLEVAIDDLPVVPVLGLGAAVQLAYRPDSQAQSLVPAAYLTAGVIGGWERLRLGARLRYLTASFTADGFPSYTTFLLEVGWRI
jgi:hypothetical protein